MQLRQVQRGGAEGGVDEGAAPGAGFVMALMERALRCGGALLLRACLLRNARGRLSTGEVHQFGERF